ncbi:cation diffusion facilitator family transporter [Motiliproteus sediminis]|uniref:cation diffusion facilitator family transporter n=1 Tax=Motiliproteus sediminis TaxID=1468178 RepID=UPI001AF02938|nr:cation transporter [Motiliproteus sediminis]
MSQESVRVVRVALFSHVAATLFKLVTGVITGSAALLSEALHSLLDVLNQAVLFSSARKGRAAGDHVYAYGHGKTRYLVNLWSSVGLFSIGCGLGLAWSIYALLAVSREQPLLDGANWTLLLAVAGGLLIQGYSFFLAARDFVGRMMVERQRNPFTYLLGCGDVTLAVIVVQSSAGLLGLMMAGAGAVATLLTLNPLWDALAALGIAVLMGWVAYYLGYLYMRYLTDVRDRSAETALRELAEARRAVERCDHIHSIILDDHRTLVFAEIELQQEAMVSGLLTRISGAKKQLLQQLPQAQRGETRALAFVTARATVEATLTRAEAIILELEQSLREQMPQVAEVSIRVRGISAFELPEPPVRRAPPTQDAEVVSP